MTPYNLAVLLLISEGASNDISADDNSIGGAAVIGKMLKEDPLRIFAVRSLDLPTLHSFPLSSKMSIRHDGSVEPID